MTRTILADVDGFTPVIDTVVDELGLMAAVVFGRIWRYCQMEDRVCKASLETIGDSIGVDKATVMRHAKDLCQAGYLKDLTPELRNRPHVYVDTGKAGITVSFSGVAQRNVKNIGVAESNATVAQRNVTVAESQLNKVFKKDSKTERETTLDFQSMNVSQARKVPTLKMYAEATDFFPGSVVWEYVHTTIQANGLTFEKLHGAAVEWAARGYKPENVKGILEWALHGIPAGKNSPAPSTPKVASDPFESLYNYLDKQEEKS